MRLKYILKRILIAIPTFFGITILAYFILNLAPGSPLDALLADPGITPAELERKRVALGLDQPVIVQYFTWLKQLLTGNLGFSYSTQRPVATMILERLPATAILAASSILLSLVVSIPLGIFAASKPNSKRDYFSGGLSMLMMATPNFFVGLVFIYLFAIVFQILPSGGMYSSSGARTFGDLMKHMILPCLVLSFQQIGGWVRHMRSSMLEVMQDDYIRTAKAKGQTYWAVVIRHALRNAMIPIVTVIGLQLGVLLAGSIVTEVIFSIAGVGKYLVDSMNARDYAAVQGCVLLIAFVSAILNLIVDIIYTFIDPRMKTMYESSKGSSARAKKKGEQKTA